LIPRTVTLFPLLILSSSCVVGQRMRPGDIGFDSCVELGNPVLAPRDPWAGIDSAQQRRCEMAPCSRTGRFAQDDLDLHYQGWWHLSFGRRSQNELKQIWATYCKAGPRSAASRAIV